MKSKTRQRTLFDYDLTTGQTLLFNTDPVYSKVVEAQENVNDLKDLQLLMYGKPG